jgi:hypothetical protein
MARYRLTCVFATLVASLAFAAPAGAQWDYGGPPVLDWLTPHLQAQQWCNVSWCRVDDSSRPTTPQERARARAKARREARAERRRKARERARERRQLRRNARNLRFVPVPEVSARVRADLIAHFAPGDTPNAVQLRAEIEGPNGPFLQFSRHFERDTDWSPHDAANVYAFALIVMWLSLQEKQSATTAVTNAVRDDIRDSMAKSRAVWAASDADQQELAERIASWTAILVGQYNHLVSLGEARPAEFPTPEEFRETIIEYVQSRHLFGIDLSAVELTRKGIVLR